MEQGFNFSKSKERKKAFQEWWSAREVGNEIVLLLEVKSNKNKDLKLEQENKRYLYKFISLVQENHNVKIKLGTYKENLLCEDPIPW